MVVEGERVGRSSRVNGVQPKCLVGRFSEYKGRYAVVVAPVAAAASRSTLITVKLTLILRINIQLIKNTIYYK